MNIISKQNCAFVARISGAPFTLTLSGVTAREPEQLAEAVRKSVYDLLIPRDRYEEEGVVTISIGGLLKTLLQRTVRQSSFPGRRRRFMRRNPAEKTRLYFIE